MLRQLFFRRSSNSSSGQGSRRHSARHRFLRPLRLEPLEHRRVLAALTVNSLADNTTEDMELTLREAVLLVNEGGNAVTALGRALTTEEEAQIDTTEMFGTNDAIDFDGSLAGGTIVLGGSELLSTQSVVITGLGADQLSISGDNQSRIFHFTNGVTSEIHDLTLVDGVGGPSGGAIQLAGAGSSLAVHRSVIRGSEAASGGGGIFVTLGSLTLADSAIVGNSASFGAIEVQNGSADISNTTISSTNSSNISGISVLREQHEHGHRLADQCDGRGRYG